MKAVARLAALGTVLAALVSLWAPAEVRADEAEVQASWVEEPAEALVGQPVIARVALSDLGASTLVGATVEDMPLIEVSRFMEADGEVALELVVFRVGRFASAGVTLTLLTPAGEQVDVVTPPFALSIGSTIANESNPAPAPSELPRPVMTPDRRPLYAGGVLLFVLMGAALGAWVRGRRDDDEEAYVPPPRPAWELVLEGLDALATSPMLEEGDHLGFHMRLSELLRMYVGARFGFPAVEATTTEIAASLRSRPDDVGAWYPIILRLLQDMDLVKFAKFAPPDDESRALLDEARQLVLDLSANERARAAAAEDLRDDAEPGTPAESEERTARDESEPHAGAERLPDHIANLDFSALPIPSARDAAAEEELEEEPARGAQHTPAAPPNVVAFAPTDDPEAP